MTAPNTNVQDPSAGYGVPLWIVQALPSSLLPYLFVPFTYSARANATTLAASATATVTTAIQSDSHFVCTDMADDTRDGSTGLTYEADPPFLVQFQNLGSGAYLSDAQVGWRSVIGSYGNTGSGPRILYVPLLLYANSSFAAVIVNNDGSNSYNLRSLAYNGFKIFGVYRNASTPTALTG